MKTVLIAGATGYLGQHLVATYLNRGWKVLALVRNSQRAHELGLAADKLIVAQATDPETLRGTMAGVDLVISAVGITRQRDGLDYRDVDYQANVNLLREAVAAGVSRFCYIHLLNAEAMLQVPLVAAKQAFVQTLRAAPVKSTVICPSGYFSDMEDFLSMARSGRVWLFGDGGLKINPIHGADLADATAEVVDAGMETREVGGPDVLSQKDLARLAFLALGRPASITCLPDWTRRLALRLLPWVTPRYIHGPAQFFLTAMGLDMVGTPYGSHHLADHLRSIEGTTVIGRTSS